MSDPPRDSDSQAVKCAKCGTLNPEGVEECLHCGASLLPPDTTQALQQQRRVPLIPRLIVSLVAGLLVFAISCDVGYRQFCGSAVRYAQTLTLRDIGRVRDAVEEYRRQHGVLPKALSDFPQVSGRVDRDGWPVDWWDGLRRLNYWTDGTHYRITSYGLDGKPGGVGLDLDLSSEDLPKGRAPSASLKDLPQRARPAFRQFVTDRGTTNSGSGRMMFLSSILTGAVTFFLAFFIVGRHAPRRGRVRDLVIILMTTVVAALYVGMTIVGFHVPSGH